MMYIVKMLRTSHVLMAGLLICSVCSFGQVHFAGVQAGLNLSNYTAKMEGGDKRFKAGLVTGVNYEYLFKGHYTLGADLLYSQLGFINQVAFAINQDGFRETDVRVGYDYLSLPLKIGYTRGEHLKGFVKTGLCPSLLVKSGVKVIDEDFPATPNKLNTYDDVPKFDLGALVEAGAGYTLKENMEFFSSLTYRRSFSTFSKEGHFQGAEMKHYLFSLSFGIKYRLKG